MEQSFSEAHSCSTCQEIPSPFMVTESSLPFSQNLVTTPYPEPYESSPGIHAQLL
jgi:hypothetical protein